jgi:membrane protein implicated in regulation of membrane protease activity
MRNRRQLPGHNGTEVGLNLGSIFSAWLIWFLLGIGLAFLELQMPGFIVLFFGVGCWVVAGALLIWPLSVTQQILVFIVATIVSIALLRKGLMKIFRGISAGRTEAGFDDFPKGARVRVVQRITPQTNGRIQYRGTFWDAAADQEIEAGETVEIIRFAGDSRQVFFVKKI